MATHQHKLVLVTTSPAYDGSAAVNRFGYCRECQCDLQSFGKAGKHGKLIAYRSHKYAKRTGVR